MNFASAILMKINWAIFIYLFMLSCTSNTDNNSPSISEKDTQVIDSTIPTILSPKDTVAKKVEPQDSSFKTGPHSNARFKDVFVERIGDSYRVRGKAQVFEAVLSWVVEDGHNQLKKGFEMTDAGAPEFGNFEFRFTINKKDNTTPHLILFESSAKDGSPQHELPIKLP